jgi:hypothetical protein
MGYTKDHTGGTMKAFTTKITIGNDSTTEQVFASDTRLAVQRAVYTATRLRHELKTGESFDMTVSIERVPYTKEMKGKHGKINRTVSGTAHECIGVRGHFVPEEYGMIGDVLTTPEGKVIGSVMGFKPNGAAPRWARQSELQFSTQAMCVVGRGSGQLG